MSPSVHQDDEEELPLPGVHTAISNFTENTPRESYQLDCDPFEEMAKRIIHLTAVFKVVDRVQWQREQELVKKVAVLKWKEAGKTA